MAEWQPSFGMLTSAIRYNIVQSFGEVRLSASQELQLNCPVSGWMTSWEYSHSEDPVCQFNCLGQGWQSPCVQSLQLRTIVRQLRNYVCNPRWLNNSQGQSNNNTITCERFYQISHISENLELARQDLWNLSVCSLSTTTTIHLLAKSNSTDYWYLVQSLAIALSKPVLCVHMTVWQYD